MFFKVFRFLYEPGQFCRVSLAAQDSIKVEGLQFLRLRTVGSERTFARAFASIRAPDDFVVQVASNWGSDYSDYVVVFRVSDSLKSCVDL